MNIDKLEPTVYAMAYVLELEMGFDGGVDDVRYEIKQDFDNCYLTVHETSKGDTVHYYDGIKEGVAYLNDEGIAEILLDEEVKKFCIDENIYVENILMIEELQKGL